MMLFDIKLHPDSNHRTENQLHDLSHDIGIDIDIYSVTFHANMLTSAT